MSDPTVSVVIPTIRGRENLLDAVIPIYHSLGEQVETIVVRDRPTCGRAWNDGAEHATGEYLMLAADDLAPHPGWLDTALEAAAAGVYPSPWIVRRDGSTECCGTLGSGLLLTGEARDGLPACSSPIPFMRRDMWPLVGPSLGTHYYSDDYLGYRARLAGLSVEVRRDYRFTHLDGQVGHRPLVARAAADRDLYAKAVSKL